MAKLIGTDPNQVPTNADLGTMAYQDKGNLSVGTVDTTGDVGINTASGLTDLTIAHYGHGLGLGHEGATLPSLAGLYTSSSTTYGQAYGSLIVKSRTDYAGYSIIFRTQSGEAARFNSAGNLAFPNGQGIDFSATGDGSGTVTSELLDDYEEGTFTPVLSFDGGTTGITYNNRGGRYTKVGNLVTVWIHFYLANKGSSSGQARVGGLPYTITQPSGTYNVFAPMGDRGNLNTSGRIVSAYISTGNDYFPLYSGGFDGSANTQVNQSMFENITEINIQLSYPAS